MGSLTYTAPSSWGWAAGSSMYAGVVYGFNGGSGVGPSGYHANGDQFNVYAGTTLNTPWKQLTTGIAFDYVQNFMGGYSDLGFVAKNDVTVIGLYATYKATDKLSLSGRGEYIHGQETFSTGGYSSEGWELTGTMEYDLWANVVSRLEVRWDQTGSVNTPESIYFDFDTLDHKYSVGLYANVIYKF